MTSFHDVPPIHERLKLCLLEWLQLDAAGVQEQLRNGDTHIFGRRLVQPGTRWRSEKQRALLRATRAQRRRLLAVRLEAAKPSCCGKKLAAPLADCRACGR
eukprot:gene8676-8709_t